MTYRLACVDTAASLFPAGIVIAGQQRSPRPPQPYHIHETGFHGTWLAEVVGSVKPRLGGLPPDVVMRSLLFQLRSGSR